MVDWRTMLGMDNYLSAFMISSKTSVGSLKLQFSSNVLTMSEAICSYNAVLFARILKRMRELVRHGLYVMTTDADEEADADDFSLFDIESAILTGKIVERQRKRQQESGNT